jgi:hypothetical protein
MIKRAMLSAAALTATLLAAGSAQARPSQSFGAFSLAVSQSDCITRARSAYASNGWSDVANGDGWVKAHKGSYASYTVCNSAPGGGVIVNIFVAYDQPDPSGDLVQAERMAVQRMVQ